MSLIEDSGIGAVEIYLSESILNNIDQSISICNEFSFKYAVHAPNDCFMPKELLLFAESIGAGIVVQHDILWDDEWKILIKSFESSNVKLCVENICSSLNWARFNRRYGLGICCDIEHLILSINGVYLEEFNKILRSADHIHMTGYTSGSDNWHNHIHHSREQSETFLKMLMQLGYTGFVVSEAKVSSQTLSEFKQLQLFFNEIVQGQEEIADHK